MLWKKKKEPTLPTVRMVTYQPMNELASNFNFRDINILTQNFGWVNKDSLLEDIQKNLAKEAQFFGFTNFDFNVVKWTSFVSNDKKHHMVEQLVAYFHANGQLSVKNTSTTALTKSPTTTVTDKVENYFNYIVHKNDHYKSFEEILNNSHMEKIEEKLVPIINSCRLNLRRNKKNSLNFVFLGNTGTGKTYLATRMGYILHASGLLSSPEVIEVNANQLQAKYTGQTAHNIVSLFANAEGKTLFIDEFYSLFSSHGEHVGFRQEALETILSLIESYKNKLAVVIAGYPKEMEEIFSRNQGLTARFNHFLYFSSLNVEQSVESFFSLLKSEQLEVENDKVKQKIRKVISEHILQAKESYENMRALQKLMDVILEQQGMRLTEGKTEFTDIEKIDEKEFLLIKEDDIPSHFISGTEKLKEAIKEENNQKKERSRNSFQASTNQLHEKVKKERVSTSLSLVSSEEKEENV